MRKVIKGWVFVMVFEFWLAKIWGFRHNLFMQLFRWLGLSLVIFVFCSTVTWGNFARTIAYEVLLVEGGSPVIQELSFRFSLWSSADAESDDIIDGAINSEAENFAGFQEVQNLAPDQDGRFIAEIGAVVGLPLALNAAGAHFLQVETKESTEPDSAYEIIYAETGLAREKIIPTTFALESDTAKRTLAETFVLNADGVGNEDTGLQFSSDGAFLEWNITNSQFEFSEALKIFGDLLVGGGVKIADETQGLGKVLTSDAEGVASWQELAVNDLATTTLSCTDTQIAKYDTDLNGDGTADDPGWVCASDESGSDNLGDHMATRNLNLNGNWLSGDGGSEGLFVDASGSVGIGDSTPEGGLLLDVEGKIGATQFCDANGGNCQVIAATTKTLSFVPEYPGAVFQKDGSDNAGSFNAGFDETNFQNFYTWYSTWEDDLQDYDIVVQFHIPADFGSWAETEAVSFHFKTQTIEATQNKVQFEFFDTGNTIADFSSAADALVSSSADIWEIYTATITGGIWIPGEFATMRLRPFANAEGKVYLGKIVLRYQTGVSF